MKQLKKFVYINSKVLLLGVVFIGMFYYLSLASPLIFIYLYGTSLKIITILFPFYTPNLTGIHPYLFLDFIVKSFPIIFGALLYIFILKIVYKKPASYLFKIFFTLLLLTAIPISQSLFSAFGLESTVNRAIRENKGNNFQVLSIQQVSNSECNGKVEFIADTIVPTDGLYIIRRLGSIESEVLEFILDGELDLMPNIEIAEKAIQLKEGRQSLRFSADTDAINRVIHGGEGYYWTANYPISIYLNTFDVYYINQTILSEIKKGNLRMSESQAQQQVFTFRTSDGKKPYEFLYTKGELNNIITCTSSSNPKESKTSKTLGLGELCEGRNNTICVQGLKCQFQNGSAADAPGICVRE